MKKIYGISLVAVLAVSPMMARAERAVAVVNYAAPTANTNVATTSYVKGAFKANSDRINALVSDTNVSANGNYIDANESVAHNLGELDTAVKTNTDAIGNTAYTGGSLTAAIAALQSDSSDLGSTKVNQNGNFTAETDSTLILGKSVVSAIKDTAAAVDANTAAIGDANSGLTKTIADEISRATNAETGLAEDIADINTEIGNTAYTGGSLSAAISALQSTASGLGNDKVNQNGNFTESTNSDLIENKTVVEAIQSTAAAVDTNTDAISTINNKAITVVNDWTNEGTAQIKLADLPEYSNGNNGQ